MKLIRTHNEQIPHNEAGGEGSAGSAGQGGAADAAGAQGSGVSQGTERSGASTGLGGSDVSPPDSTQSADASGQHQQSGSAGAGDSAGSQRAHAEDGLVSELFDNGRLKPDYQQTLQKHGLESAVGYFGREGLGGNLDAIVKSLSNLVPMMGKQVEGWDVSALPPMLQDEMRSKLVSPAPAADQYNWDLPALQDVEVDDSVKQYWGEVANKAGASQEIFEAFVTANQELAAKQGQQATEASEAQLQQQGEAITAHFRGEWGDGYDYNKTLVEGWVAENLDVENDATDRALVHSQKGIDMIYRLALAEKQGRAEPQIADGGDGGSDWSTAQDEYQEFIGKHPEYVNDADPRVRREGARLRDLAFAARKRSQGL